MVGGAVEGSREDREKRYGPTQNAAMRFRPETPKTKRCAVARKETMRGRFVSTEYWLRRCPLTPDPSPPPDKPPTGPCRARAGERGERGPPPPVHAALTGPPAPPALPTGPAPGGSVRLLQDRPR